MSTHVDGLNKIMRSDYITYIKYIHNTYKNIEIYRKFESINYFMRGLYVFIMNCGKIFHVNCF